MAMTALVEEVKESKIIGIGEEPAEEEESEEKLKHSNSQLKDKVEKKVLAVPVAPAMVIFPDIYIHKFAVIVTIIREELKMLDFTLN